MIAAKTVKKWKRVTVELSPQAINLIDQLLATGLHGLCRAEVCERFILEKLRATVEEPRLVAKCHRTRSFFATKDPNAACTHCLRPIREHLESCKALHIGNGRSLSCERVWGHADNHWRGALHWPAIVQTCGHPWCGEHCAVKESKK